MSRLTVLLILIGIAALGLLRLVGRRLRWKREKKFVEDYLARFRQLAADEPFDPALYDWLVFRSTKMQTHLGALGLSTYAATPYNPLPIPTDPLIVNTLSEIRAGKIRPEQMARCEDAMMRHLGTLDEARAGHTRQLLNPVIWLGEGVRGALLLPLLALQWLGLFREPFVDRLAERKAFRFLSGLVAVIGALASLLILVQGWDAFTQQIAQWIGRLLP